MKIKGWILSYTIILTLISTLTLTTMIVVIGFQQQLLASEFNDQKLKLNRVSGLNMYLTNHNTSEYDYLMERFKDDIKIKQRSWGGATLIEIKCFAGIDSLINHALIGSKPLSEDPVLILDDSPHALKVSGRCKINGTIKIPSRGIDIMNKLYSPINMDIGSAKITNENYQTTNPNITPVKIYSNNFFYLSDITAPNQQYSFKSNTRYYFSDLEIELSNNLQGNIIIESDKAIVIYPQCNLKDVILKAPMITIKDNWSGTLQLFTNNLVLGQHVSLLYPSLIHITSLKKTDSFHFNKTNLLNGYLKINALQECTITPLINGQINGYINSNIPIDFSADLSGQVSCPNIKHSTTSTSYINLIYNATLIDQFQKDGIAIPYILPNHKNEFIKWLN